MVKVERFIFSRMSGVVYIYEAEEVWAVEGKVHRGLKNQESKEVFWIFKIFIELIEELLSLIKDELYMIGRARYEEELWK